MNLFINKPMN